MNIISMLRPASHQDTSFTAPLGQIIKKEESCLLTGLILSFSVKILWYISVSVSLSACEREGHYRFKSLKFPSLRQTWRRNWKLNKSLYSAETLKILKQYPSKRDFESSCCTIYDIFLYLQQNYSSDIASINQTSTVSVTAEPSEHSW